LPSGTLVREVSAAHWTSTVYFAAVIFDALRTLFLRYRVSAGAERAQLLALLLGTLATALIGACSTCFSSMRETLRSSDGSGPRQLIMVTVIAFAIVATA
jgi:ABC-type transport system involved in cytochrome c biogenesis permease component